MPCSGWGGSAPGGGACSRGVPAPAGCGDPPQKQTATVADDTHPTRTHSFFGIAIAN